MNKKYFYFASPHSFEYPFFTKLMFKKKNGGIIHCRDNSKWVEVKNYNYYGEPVNCIIPAQTMDYDFVFSLLSSENNDNIFGAVNYMLVNFQDKFIQDVKNETCPRVALDILLKYFSNDRTKTGDGSKTGYGNTGDGSVC